MSHVSDYSFQWNSEPSGSEQAPGNGTPVEHHSRTTDSRRAPTAKGRPAGNGGWRLAWHCLPVVLAAAVLWMLLGPVTSVGRAAFISYNGIPLAISGSVSPTQVRDALRAQEPRAGAQLDVAGDVRSLVGGSAATPQVADATVSPNSQLVDGARVLENRGRDVAEKLVKSTRDIPHGTVIKGSGSIVVVETKGQNGVGETYAGASSKRIVAELVVKEPVNTVLRKTSTAKSKMAALTFDDGPGKWTDAVLAALASRGVKATFFMLGGDASEMPNEVKKVRAAGHEIANHTWSHADLTKLSEPQVRNEIQRADNVLGPTRYLRPPYGNYNKTVAAVAGSLGKELVLWTVDTLDWQNHNADAIMANLEKELSPGAIILMHDGGGDRAATVAAIPRVIDYLLSKGYGITTLENLVGG